MKKWFLIVILFLPTVCLFAKGGYVDSLKQELERNKNDTTLFIQLTALGNQFLEINPDSSLYYFQRALVKTRKLKLRMWEAFTLGKIGYAHLNKGNYPESLKSFLSAMAIAQKPENEQSFLPSGYLSIDGFSPAATPHTYRLGVLGFIHQFTGILFENVNDYEKELYHLRYAKQYVEQIGDSLHLAEVCYVLGRVYLLLQKNDSALMYELKASAIARRAGSDTSGVLLTLGKYYLAVGNDDSAVIYLRQAQAESNRARYTRGVIASSLLLSEIARKHHKIDSSFYFAYSALDLSYHMNSPDLLLRTWSELVAIYTSLNRNDSIAKYQGLIIRLKDSVFNSKQVQQFQNIDFEERQRQQEIENVKKTYRQRFQTYALVSGLIAFFLIAIFLWRNNRNKQRAYRLLTKQKQETDFQKTKVEQTLNELKSTQAQLIQSEKMASLGELTAGIAHEIQNPLNFVNNFSDVNEELIDEAKQEIDEGHANEVKVILDNIKDNERKINHHGKRADAIVKGMLQHSRTSSGQKEWTDINTLCDEYLRLAYYGLRAKDKSFNAMPITIGTETDFDPTLPKMNVVPQDIGRVILNLINNAFYAVSERKKLQAANYEPLVVVRTKWLNNQIEIIVEDNGIGIQKNIVDKIFQPFFTTKPTGQGTGLGLSLAYDIVKAHGGEIKVETEQGKGSKFIVHLPP